MNTSAAGTGSGAPAGAWVGTSGFRMYPGEPFAEAPSTAEVRSVAGGTGLAVEYTWLHPEDGPQTGFLVFGEPAETGAVVASFLDSWHQRTGPATLLGTSSETAGGQRLAVFYDYADGWSWQVVFGPSPEGLALTMSNVVPEDVDGAPAGPYEVMVARWVRGPRPL